MQVNFSSNIHVAKAMLRTVENLHSDLNQTSSFVAAFVKTQDCAWKDLTQFIESAQNHTKNLELTLLEEIELAAELEVDPTGISRQEIIHEQKEA